MLNFVHHFCPVFWPTVHPSWIVQHGFQSTCFYCCITCMSRHTEPAVLASLFNKSSRRLVSTSWSLHWEFQRLLKANNFLWHFYSQKCWAHSKRKQVASRCPRVHHVFLILAPFPTKNTNIMLSKRTTKTVSQDRLQERFPDVGANRIASILLENNGHAGEMWVTVA